MCDSNHQSTKPIYNKMPSSNVVSSPKLPRERGLRPDSRHTRSNPEDPYLDDTMGAATIRPSSSDQHNNYCSPDFQLSSSPLSFEDVQDVPNWRNQQETENGVNHVNVKYTRNLEKLPIGNVTEKAPITESTTDFEPRPSESTLEVRLWPYNSKTKGTPSTDRREKLDAQPHTNEFESCRKHATCDINGGTTPVENIAGNATGDGKQDVCRNRSETEAENETKLDETKSRSRRRDSEKCSLKPCAETKTGFDETCKTETGFGLTGDRKIGFDEACDSETGSNNDRLSTTSVQSKFDASKIETVTHEMLQRVLARVTYDPQRCRTLSHDLAGQVLKRTIGLAPKRYKLVVFVSIGSLTDNPGIQFGSRCLWDADTDQLATVRYANETLFAVVLVYGLYRE